MSDPGAVDEPRAEDHEDAFAEEDALADDDALAEEDAMADEEDGGVDEDEGDDEIDDDAADAAADDAAAAATVARDAGGSGSGARSLKAHAVLAYLARSLTDEPDAVRIDASPTRNGTRLSLQVAQEDMGRVIGRRGRVAQSIRSVVRAAGAAEGRDVSVDIVD